MEVSIMKLEPRKCIILLIIVFVITNILLACNVNEDTCNPQEDTVGNTQEQEDRRFLRSIYATDEYFIFYDEDYKIFIKKIDGLNISNSKSQQITDTEAGFIGTIGNYLYLDTWDGIFKFSIEDSTETKITTFGAKQYYIINDCIVFTSNEDSHIYKIDINNLKLKRISINQTITHTASDSFVFFLDMGVDVNESRLSYNKYPYTVTDLDGKIINKFDIPVNIERKIVGEDVYFIGNEDGFLYKLNINNKQLEKLVETDTDYCFFVIDEYIYYKNYEELEYPIYRIKSDGTEATKVINQNVDIIDIKNGWIYFMNFNDYLYRTFEGEENYQSLNLDCVSNVIVYHNYIYFTEYDKKYDEKEKLVKRIFKGIYRIKLDGSDKELIIK
jgi:outer membrane protein assembly factor BamB